METFDAREKALGDLFEARSSDEIRIIVAKAGLRVDWQFTGEEGVSD